MHQSALYCFLILFTVTTSSQAQISDISPQHCAQMIKSNVMNDSAPVPCKRLKVISFNHVNFEGKTQAGKLVVLDAVASYVDNIMQSLYRMKFPIHQAKLAENFDGDDERSMQANNTSAFNYRDITGKQSISLHAYGTAIDINPLQNPFVSFTRWGSALFKPQKGYQYLNRKQYRLGKAPAQGFAEQVIDIFSINGFRIWGGDWDTPIDFQHFQTSREIATLMANLSADDAALFFNNHVHWYQQCVAFSQSEQQTLNIISYADHLHSKLKKGNADKTKLLSVYQHTPTLILKLIKNPQSATADSCFI